MSEDVKRIAVVGCGHVGLVTAAGLAALGHSVTGIDTDRSRIMLLQAGEVPFHEPGLADLVSQMEGAGRLRFAPTYDDNGVADDVVFLCVSTPSSVAGAADLSYVRSAVEDLAAVLVRRPTQPVVVNKSTSPIGTGDTIDGILQRAFESSGLRSPAIVANPEFLREGHGLHDFFHPSRIVVGSADERCARGVAALYRGVRAPVLVTDLRSAEMIKYVSNAYLATRVSFANEVAGLCETLGIEARAVLRGASLDPRIGSEFFSPGAGYGGSCLPKDVAALCHVADCLGTPLPLLGAVQHVNAQQKKHVVNALRRLCGGLDGKVIAVWGLSFKGGTDDVRDSPALDVVALLRNEGATVRPYDPAFAHTGAEFHGAGVFDSAEESCRGADAVCVLTGWQQFATVDLRRARQCMRGAVLYDAWDIIDARAAERAGFRYAGVEHPDKQLATEEVHA